MSPDQIHSGRLQALVRLALLAAAGAFLGAVLEHESPLVGGACWIATVVATLVAARGLGRAAEPSRAASGGTLALFALPGAGELAARMAGSPQHPWEVVLIASMLALGLGLAVAGGAAGQPLAMASALFVTLFSASLSGSAATCVGAAAFALSGVAWLTLGHWSRFARPARPAARRGFPLRAVLVSTAAVLLPLAGIGAIEGDRLWALAGFLPTSGGEGRDDQTARRGIGDGETLVAGQDDIQSFGPIEDAPFRTSEEPSLYDLFNDMYEEPVRQKNDRAIGLPPQFNSGAAERELAQSQRATREFSTHRRRRVGTERRIKNLESEALFYVKGRTPLHLRHAVFDLFDGVDWHPAGAPPLDQPPFRLVERQGRAWLEWDVPLSGNCFAAPETHALKVVHLKSNVIPTPVHLRGVHVDQLDQTTLFRWATDDLLAMDRDNLPELTAIHLRSQAVEVRALSELQYWGKARHARLAVLPVGADIDRVRELARNWTTGLPRGWPQIEAVLRRLRTEYVHDPEAKPPEDVDCPVAHFLTVSRRGPDYLFATAAAVLLRSLDYPTRLVGGFYASPGRYDRRRRHTPVVGGDAHVWVEVFHSGRTWFTLEPTPGYELLGPPPTLLERAWRAVHALALGVARHWLLCTGLGVAGVLAWRRRRRLLERAALLWWRWLPAREPRARILQTIRLVDYRLELHQQRRPPGRSPEAWYADLHGLDDRQRQALVALARLADWAAFSPGDSPESQRVADEAASLTPLIDVIAFDSVPVTRTVF